MFIVSARSRFQVVSNRTLRGITGARHLWALGEHGSASKSHRETRVIPYSQREVYDVIADTDRYREFVPWCTGSRTIKRFDDQSALVELTVGFDWMSERYTSLVKFDEPNSVISVRAPGDRSLFNKLESRWYISPGRHGVVEPHQQYPEPIRSSHLLPARSEGSSHAAAAVPGSVREKYCTVTYEVEFEFASALYGSVAGMFFDQVVQKMIQAFTVRCRELAKVRQSSFEAQREVIQDAEPGARYGDTETGARDDDTSDRSSSDEKVIEEVVAIQHRQMSLEHLRSLSHFSVAEFEAIKNRFDHAVAASNKCTSDKDSSLGMEEASHVLLDLLIKPLGSDMSERNKLADQLSPTLHSLTKSMDLNSDESISLKEFVAGASTLIMGTQEERIRLWFRCFDTNQDGFVTIQELNEMIYAALVFQDILLQIQSGKQQTWNWPKPPASYAKELTELCQRRLALQYGERISVRDLQRVSFIRDTLFP